MRKTIYIRRFDMGVGRIEIVDGKKQYVPYAGLGGGEWLKKKQLKM